MDLPSGQLSLILKTGSDSYVPTFSQFEQVEAMPLSKTYNAYLQWAMGAPWPISRVIRLNSTLDH